MKHLQTLVLLSLITSLLLSCMEDKRYSMEKWKTAGPTERNRIYLNNHTRFEGQLIGESISKTLEILGKPEYNVELNKNKRFCGYSILDSSDYVRSYHWLDVYYDSTSKLVINIEERDD